MIGEFRLKQTAVPLWVRRFNLLSISLTPTTAGGHALGMSQQTSHPVVVALVYPGSAEQVFLTPGSMSAVPASATEASALTWCEHAIAFNDMKWPMLQYGSRRSYAECLAMITAKLVTSAENAPDLKVLFRPLAGWAFKKTVREAGPPPPQLAEAIAWITERSIPLAELRNPRQARASDATTLTMLDGRTYSAKSRRNKRQVLLAALNHAVELELLDHNPL